VAVVTAGSRNTHYRAARYGLTRTGLAPAGLRQPNWRLRKSRLVIIMARVVRWLPCARTLGSIFSPIMTRKLASLPRSTLQECGQKPARA